MKAPPPLRQDPELGPLLESARQTRDWSPGERARALARLEAKLSPRQRRASRWLLAAAVPAALLIFVIAGRGGRSSTTIAIPGVGTVQVSKGARFHAVADTGLPETRFVLDEGRILAEVAHRQPGRPFVVVTPQLRVVVVGTRFSVETEGGHSWVAVTEGRVRAESTQVRGATAEVGAGERLSSDDLRLAAPPPVAPPSSSASDCEHAVGAGRRTCLEQLAEGDDLRAQNALYELAQLAASTGDQNGAAARLRVYLRRFPDGLLVAEAEVALAEALAKAGLTDEARAACEQFLTQFPTDSLRPRIEVLRARLSEPRSP